MKSHRNMHYGTSTTVVETIREDYGTEEPEQEYSIIMRSHHIHITQITREQAVDLYRTLDEALWTDTENAE